MPNFFFYSDTGDGLFLARRFEKEGHAVRAFIHDAHAKDVYKGLLQRIVPSPDPRTGEIVVFDMVKHGAVADRLRRRGFKVVGGSTFADQIEINRPVGATLMRDVGIRIPETYVFSKLSDGQRFLQSQKGKWFYKPSGNVSTSTTIDGEPFQLLRDLEHEKLHPPKQFELQRGMSGDVTEISLEGWFDGSRFVWPFNSTVEDKRLGAGDTGPRTGCMANIVWGYDESRPLLAVKTLCRLEARLEREHYVGPIDINLILDKEGTPFGLEWSPRFGYDAIQALSHLVQGDFGHQMAQFVEGKLEHFDVRTDAYALTMGLSVPPFPDHSHARDATGHPIDQKVLTDPWIYPKDVMVGHMGPVVSGADASVATVGAVGTDINLLRTEVKEKAKGLRVQHLQYRIDPVMRTESVLAALSKYGYEGSSVRLEAPKPVVREAAPAKEVKGPRTVPGDSDRPDNANAIPDAAFPNYEMPTFNS